MSEEEKVFSSFEEAESYFNTLPDKAKLLKVFFVGESKPFAFFKPDCTLKEQLDFEEKSKENKTASENTNFIPKKILQKNIEKYKGILENVIIELWRDEHGNSYATILNENHKENWSVSSRQFKNFITRNLYQQQGKLPDSQAIKTLQDIFTAEAQFNGKSYQTYLRCARNNGGFYIDLCRNDWKVLEITRNEIQLIESPLKFKRFKHMQELKYDLEATAEDLDLIFKYARIENEKDMLHFKVDCIAQIHPDIPRVIDVFYGSAGSSKTFTMKCKRKLIDPSSMPTLSLSKDKTELIQKISHHYICNFDNVRKVSNEFSDIFCRVVTGDAFSKRELYTDDEDIIYQIKRKLMFNGINVVGEEPDFLDRSITYELSRIPKTERKQEKELIREFEKDQPKITGATFKILQKALNKIDSINIKELPRMADYCFWGEAIAQSMGVIERVFTLYYFEKVGALSKEALEANPVGLCLLEYMKENENFEGTPSQLLETLKGLSEILKIDKNYFPKAPNTLTRRINEIKANLQEENIILNEDRTGKQRILTISKKKPETIVTSVISSQNKKLTFLSSETPKFKGIENDGISDDTFQQEDNTVISNKKMTIMTINDDTSKNIVTDSLSSVNKEKNRGNDDNDNTFQKFFGNFTEEEQKVIQELNLPPEDLQVLIKARQEALK